MKLKEAIEATHKVYVGVEARTIKRKDRRGRTWYLITSRGTHFLIRPDKTAYKKVSQTFADTWSDWEPQSEFEAKKESAFMNSSRGLGMRNVILKLVLGPLPENMKAPDYLPEDI
jgi:hypothetical protein